MEPMALGSPSGSPATNPSPYLPSFLMGETQVPTTPRNTLSPNKGARNLTFAASPGPTSPLPPQSEYNRFTMSAQKGAIFNNSMGGNYSGQQGPPTQGLFDSLCQERNQVQTPVRSMQAPGNISFGTPIMGMQQQQNSSAYGMSQSFGPSPTTNGAYNESSFLGNNNNNNISYNTSRGIVSPLGPATPNASMALNNNSYMLQCPPTPRYTEFWITVFGFPPSATSTILQHFAQCGTIVDKLFPPQNGNWVHLKYASRLECDKALNYNEKILGNNIMIGVTQCKEKSIVEKENMGENCLQPCKVRPLAQAAYKCAQTDTSVVGNPNAPQKSSGLIDKAMDLFFGW